MKKYSKLKIGLHIFSILYLCLVVFDFVVIYSNEKERPERDRLYGSIELIDYSFKLDQLISIEEIVDQMIDNNTPEWQIFNYIEYSCKAIDPEVHFLKSNKYIKGKFKDTTIIEYDATKSFIHLTKKYIPSDKLFTFFPNLLDLHIIYKKMDYNEYVIELQGKYENIDFTSIENKYDRYSTWILPRFVFFGFLLWFIPVSIGYSIIFLICRQ